MSHVTRKPVFWGLRPACSALSRQQTTKTLIRLCGAASLLFASNTKQVFSWRGSNMTISCPFVSKTKQEISIPNSYTTNAKYVSLYVLRIKLVQKVCMIELQDYLTTLWLASCKTAATKIPALLEGTRGFAASLRKLRGTLPSWNIWPTSSPRYVQIFGISISISSANSKISNNLEERRKLTNMSYYRNDPKFLGNECRPMSDCSSMSSLIRVHTICQSVYITVW